MLGLSCKRPVSEATYINNLHIAGPNAYAPVSIGLNPCAPVDGAVRSPAPDGVECHAACRQLVWGL